MQGKLVREENLPRHIILAERGLVDDSVWEPVLSGYPTDLVRSIRKNLIKLVPDLREKFNAKQRYFGYKKGFGPDTAYIYVQGSKLVIDLRVDPKFAEDLRRDGFAVLPRENFQGRAGWLTGWQVPHSARKAAYIAQWFRKALSGECWV